MSPKRVQQTFGALRHYAVLAVVAWFVLFPYFWMVSSSLKPAEELMLSPPNWLPSHLDFSAYQQVWDLLPLLKYMGNSLFVAAMTTILALVLASCAGYSLSRYKTRLRKFSIALFVFTQLIPSVLPFISYYFLMHSLGLTNTYAGLILTYAIWAIPFSIMMMQNYFTAAVPGELEESGMIDGLSRIGVFLRIVLPISVPGLVATGIFAFILSWNEFMWASVMLTNNDLKPVSIGIFDFVGQYSSAGVTNMMATSVISTAPAIILFGILQRYLISGLTAGAVKG